MQISIPSTSPAGAATILVGGGTENGQATVAGADNGDAAVASVPQGISGRDGFCALLQGLSAALGQTGKGVADTPPGQASALAATGTVEGKDPQAGGPGLNATLDTISALLQEPDRIQSLTLQQVRDLVGRLRSVLRGAGERRGSGSAAAEGSVQAADALACLLALLPPTLQQEVRQWAGAGSALPDPPGQAQIATATTGASGHSGWLVVARRLLALPAADDVQPSGSPAAGQRQWSLSGGLGAAAGGAGQSSIQPPSPGDDMAPPLSLEGTAEAPSGQQGGAASERYSAADSLKSIGHAAGGQAGALASAKDQVSAARRSEAGSQVADLDRLLAQPIQSQAPAPLQDGGAAGVSTLIAQPRPAVAQSIAPPPAVIDVPPGEEAWTRALGERVTWMVGHQVQSAEVHLNPPDLGPLEIRISLHQDQASVSFTAQHPFTRDALEAALPRLRDMMGQANIDLVSVDVGQRDPGGARSGQGRATYRGGGTLDGGGEGLTVLTTPVSARQGRGLVDDFA
jgi:flagellar hook-length control protein FliK